jgi:glycosyltransferase involved in cell wall biosynthesis
MQDRLITVIISTWNRCTLLADVLKGLAAQGTDGVFDYEVIVADNNSTDRTKETVASFAARFNGPLSYIFEKRQGKSFALNAALRQANGKIIAFTDDDVFVDRNWLRGLWSCFERFGCDAAGGRILPVYPPRTPAWVLRQERYLEGPLGFHDYGDAVMPSAGLAPFAGANMAIRTDCLPKEDWFRTDLGTGDLPPGEDTALCDRLRRMGKNVYYCGTAVVHHRIEAGKLTRRFMVAWGLKIGISEGRRRTRKEGVLYFGYPRWILKHFLANLAGLLLNFFNRSNYISYWMRASTLLGTLIEYKRKGVRSLPAKKTDARIA